MTVDRVPQAQSLTCEAEAAEIAALRSEVEQLKVVLSSRAVIDQAKGIVMSQQGVDAAAAFEELVRRSQRSGLKLQVVAENLTSSVPGASSGNGDGTANPE